MTRRESSAIVFPKRLVDGENRAAALIRDALAEKIGGPSEARSFELLSGRPPRQPHAGRWVFAIGAMAALALFSAQSLLRSEQSLEPKITATAESWTPKRALPAARELGAPEVQPEPAQPKLERAPPARSARPDPAASDTASCAELSRAGKYEAAVQCYGHIAQGSSMAAEIALYEKARLESRALGRGAAALATLDEHGRRFPSGVLASEVGMTRIELLIRLGRGENALAAIESGLKGPLGRERGGDLQALRADLLSTRGDCVGARAALSLARAAGVHPSRLQTAEQRCPAADDAANVAPRSNQDAP